MLGPVAGACGVLTLSALLVSIAVSDRRSAWRFRPEPARPGRVLSPTVATPVVIDLRNQAALTGPGRSVAFAAVPAASADCW